MTIPLLQNIFQWESVEEGMAVGSSFLLEWLAITQGAKGVVGCPVFPGTSVVQLKEAEKVNCNRLGRWKWPLNRDFQWHRATVREGGSSGWLTQARERLKAAQGGNGSSVTRGEPGLFSQERQQGDWVIFLKALTVLDRNFTAIFVHQLP